MSKDVQADVETMIDKHDGKAAIEAWRKAGEFVNGVENREKFEHWFQVASILQDLEGR